MLFSQPRTKSDPRLKQLKLGMNCCLIVLKNARTEGVNGLQCCCRSAILLSCWFSDFIAAVSPPQDTDLVQCPSVPTFKQVRPSGRDSVKSPTKFITSTSCQHACYCPTSAPAQSHCLVLFTLTSEAHSLLSLSVCVDSHSLFCTLF